MKIYCEGNINRIRLSDDPEFLEDVAVDKRTAIKHILESCRTAKTLRRYQNGQVVVSNGTGYEVWSYTLYPGRPGEGMSTEFFVEDSNNSPRGTRYPKTKWIGDHRHTYIGYIKEFLEREIGKSF